MVQGRSAESRNSETRESVTGSGIVERVALAMQEACEGPVGDFETGPLSRPHECYVVSARSAIATMREMSAEFGDFLSHVVLQARRPEVDNWTNIYPAQLEQMSKDGNIVRAVEVISVEASGVMDVARRAANRVAGWSPAKQDFARRVSETFEQKPELRDFSAAKIDENFWFTFPMEPPGPGEDLSENKKSALSESSLTPSSNQSDPTP